ncbi:hypothetical protein R69658_06556 [Paraburkholderia aspalathi]|uniref:DUF1845 domain-containing protein n=1 Tax=Paraburkholderia aspalathi TaxID=1324617 RepID=A0ABN7N1C3_9BURK|nr:DUF1845 domain-containing protein [Paraburkholderia aspalathi]MBK3822921.1 DUF1845 domain-containing protein [Paraburkholderia aspalathi]MBK3834754.1 DUF1845 domain-containing protein [Paraburkholderia aspalathi]MBK3864480.1 DUF1845 domain-containing protein [Paraburkholderia aspalathi]CAE6837147.1 hypothetical protein R69658_06556 [Paraburkholderia aspalathi]
MAAVLELPSDPDRPADSDDARPALALAASSAEPVPPAPPASSGLKPIARLTSDSRVARIVPESDAVTVLLYSSQFARDFIRSDYNFCAAKIAVARGGKVRALETALRDAANWFRKTNEWISRHDARGIELPHETIELIITRPLAGLLVRCLTLFDRVFVGTLEALLAEKISSTDRANILTNAEKRIKHIVQVCMPDNDQYDFDGERRGQ